MSISLTFQDRSEAGRLLAARLAAYAHRADVAVVALPRGGVPVGYEVARALDVPLDVLPVRKLGAPQNPEFAMGAIASGGVQLLDRAVVDGFGVPPQKIEAISEIERAELERQEKIYRGCRNPLVLRDRVVILVDDGLATGWTMRAAIAALRREQPARIVVAVPVAAPSMCRKMEAEAEEMVCLSTPARFQAVGQAYREFSQVSDRQVCELLQGVRGHRENDRERL